MHYLMIYIEEYIEYMESSVTFPTVSQGSYLFCNMKMCIR